VGEPLARIFAMPGVVYRPLAPSPPMSRLGVAWRQDAASTTLRWFLKVLDELAEAAGTGADGRLDGAAARNGRRAASTIMAV
jgi:hypothetical protein